MTDATLEALSACIRLSRKLLQTAAAAETMTATDIVACGALAKPWSARIYDTEEPADKLCQYNGVVYELWQSHDSTDNPQWTPDAVPALWRQYHTTDPARATPFVQPTGSHDTYMMDECMVYTDGMTYQSTIDNNAYSPTDYPAGWQVIDNAG